MELRSSGRLISAFLLVPVILVGCGTLGDFPVEQPGQAKLEDRGQGLFDSIYFEQCLDCSSPSYFAKSAKSIARIDASGWTTRGGVRYQFSDTRSDATIHETGESIGHINYLKSTGSRDSYSTQPTNSIEIREIYAGVSAEFVGATNGALQYNLLLDAGVSPELVSITVSNADKIFLDEFNALHVIKDAQDVVHSAPFIYQETSAGRVQVAGNFVVEQDRVRFDVPGYDSKLPLVIDPTLTHINVFGGSQNDVAIATAIADNGDLVVAGISNSPDLPTQAAFEAAHQGNDDLFVLRTDSATGGVVYLTYLGGSGKDELEEVAFDASQNLILVGGTNSIDFPTLNPYQASRAGQQDAFVTALTPTGDALAFSTYFGGLKRESFYDVEVAVDGTLVLGGRTKSADFPTEAPFQATYSGAGDGMLVRMSGDASILLMSTFIGGSGLDHVTGVVDIGGTIHFSGDSESTDMPVVNAFQANNAGGSDGYLGRLTSAGDDLAFGTYVGGSNFDKVVALAAMPAGDIAYVGATLSTDLPTLLPVQADNAGQRDMFMGRVSGNTPLFSSYWGGATYDRAETVVVDNQGNWFVAGDSYRNFPTVDALPDPQLPSGGNDLAVVALDINNQVWFSSAVAVNGKQTSHAAILDQNQNLVFAGVTNNSAIELGAPPPATGALLDAIVMRIEVATNAAPLITSTPITSVNQNESYSYAVIASDADQDVLSFSLTAAPTGMTISSTGVINWLPGVPGIYDVTVSVDDSNGGVATQAFQITVIEVILNGDPEITSSPITIASEGMPYEYGVIATDPDQDPLTFALSVAPAGMTISVEGLISWLADVSGLIDVTVTVDDSNGGVASQSYQIDVTAAPTGPVITPISDISALVGEEVNLSVVASDPLDGDVSLGISPLPLPEGLIFNAVTGKLRWLLTAENVGDSIVTITASADGITNSETFAVSVAQPDPTAPTGVSGVVYDATAGANGEDLPVVGAVIELLGTGISATTDSNGSFSMAGEVTGGQLLIIDASGAQLAPDGSTYANFQEQIVLPPNVITEIDRPFFMPRINAGSVTQIEGVSEIVVNNADIGASIVVLPSRVRNPDGSAFTGAISISEVPKNLAPVALPKHLDPAILVTVQPAGITFTTPVPLTVSNVDGLPPGTILDLWSVDPARGVFGIVGKSQVSADGETITTIEGGLRNATWSLNAPLPLSSGPSDNPPGPNTNPKGCNKNTGSTVAIGSGCISTSFALPSYRSQGKSRELEFVYKSIRAFPTEIISVDTNIPMFSPVPLSFSYELSVDGLIVQAPVFVNPLTDAGLIRRSRGGIPFDTSQHATGIYDYELTTRGNLSFSSTVDTLGGQLAVVNDSAGPFGAGWGLSDLKRLHLNGTGRFLLVDGDGTKQIFNQLRPILIGSFDQDRSLSSADGNVNYSFVDGDLFSAFKDDLMDVSQFGRNGTVSRTVSFRPGIDEITLETIRGLDIFVLTQESEGQELSFSERAVLDQFVQEGGAVLELARQPRDEPVLGTSSELVSNPGNTSSYFFVSTANEHPVKDGPFGRAGLIDGGQNASSYDVVGAGAELALRSGSPVVLDFPIGTENAAGAALLFGDSSIATSNHPTNGVENRYTTRNRMALLNSIAYLASVPGFRVNDDVGGEEFFGPPGDFSELVRLPDGTFRQTMKNGMSYLFDTAGFQTSKVDRNGNVTTYSYSAGGLLESIADPKDLETTLSYTGGKLQTITDPAGRVSAFVIDLNGDLESITFPDGASKSYEYNERHLMERETNERGFVTTREYDLFGLFESSVLPDGAERSYAPPKPIIAFGSTSTTPVPATSVSRSLSSFTDGKGHITQRTVDRLGLLTLLTDEEGRTWEIDRDFDGNPLRTTYPNGLQRTRTFDDSGNELSSSNDLDGASVVNAYDSFGARISRTDELGNTSNTIRDSRGNPVKMVNALGHESSFVWDTQGRLIGGTSPNGLVSTMTYNEQGLQDSLIRQPISGPTRTTTFEYDSAGNRVTNIRPNGFTTTSSYDENGRIISMIDSLQREFFVEYDAAGNPIRHEKRDGLQTGSRFSYQYDPLNRLSGISRPHLAGTSSQQVTYDLAGNAELWVDGTGDETTYNFDTADRLESIVDSEDGVLAFSRASDDNFSSVGAPNGVNTEYSFDLLGRVESESSPDRGGISYEYDLKGRLTATTDARGITLSIEYDALDRTTLESYSDNLENVSHIYDSCVGGVGKICQRVDQVGNHSWSYDSYGNILTSNSTIDDVQRSIAFTYNSVDGIISITLPSGRVVSMIRDLANRVVSISTDINGVATQVVSGVQYRADGVATRLTYGNSVQEVRSYDMQRRMIGWAVGDVVNWSYSYDEDGNLLSVLGADYERSHSYDSLNRVTSEALNSNSPITYTYDRNGNRLTKDVGQTSQTYSYAEESNRLVSVSGTPLTYDASGNLVRDENGRAYSYNQAGRLITLEAMSGELLAQYFYNGAGQRVKKVVDGSTTVYSYDLVGNLVSETRENGDLIREYIWLDGVPVAQIDVEAGVEILTFLHSDYLGAPKFATDLEGLLVWRWTGGAFGDDAADEDPGGAGVNRTINLRFPGQYFDAESGLHYNYFRYYNPKSGRYNRPDPIGLSGSLNGYAYVNANPLGAVDPDGLLTILITTYDGGVGTHSAVYIKPDGKKAFLYDPGGGYRYNGQPRGSGGFFEGGEANLESYIKHHEDLGSEVELVSLPTTPDQEKDMIDQAEEWGDTGPFSCSRTVSRLLAGSCDGIEPGTFWPKDLAKDALPASCPVD